MMFRGCTPCPQSSPCQVSKLHGCPTGPGPARDSYDCKSSRWGTDGGAAYPGETGDENGRPGLHVPLQHPGRHWPHDDRTSRRSVRVQVIPSKRLKLLRDFRVVAPVQNRLGSRIYMSCCSGAKIGRCSRILVTLTCR